MVICRQIALLREVACALCIPDGQPPNLHATRSISHGRVQAGRSERGAGDRLSRRYVVLSGLSGWVVVMGQKKQSHTGASYVPWLWNVCCGALLTLGWVWSSECMNVVFVSMGSC